ncbi:MAG: hypothetical protein PHN84_12950 [Desulfuromonadaceae bacterium]|nr:hypothetical protein [Desulfuromonadaceae bacterium]MDD2854457.1 hypothetical protein [Desulfuromonadaceae bacterium]
MILDQELAKAVEEAVKETNQPNAVATRIIKWLEGMSKGEISRADNDEFFSRTLMSIKSQYTAEAE